MLVTFDLFSALLDSRAGASAAFGPLAGARGWPAKAEAVYDDWDRRNKQLQRDLAEWRSFRQLCAEALAGTYAALQITGDPQQDTCLLLDSVGSWPLWPDVAGGLPLVSGHYDVGVLSNVDDDILARTAAAPLVDHRWWLTSQRLRACKPAPAIYHRARDAAPRDGYVHVATSARDVRGALDAGIDVIRLIRPGHHVPAAEPRLRHVASSLDEVAVLLAEHWPR